MATNQRKLTVQEVKKIQPGESLTDTDGLRVGRNKSGSLFFLYRYRFNGKQQAVSCGGNDTTLVEAREARDEFKRLIRQGIDPKHKKAIVQTVVRQESAGGITFGAVFDEYWTTIKKPEITAEKDQRNWPNSVHQYFDALLAMPIADITPSMIADCLRPTWMTKNETMWRTRQKGHQTFDFAVAKDYTDKRNPFDKSLVEKLLPKHEGVESHHPSMDFELIPQFYLNLSNGIKMGSLQPQVAALAAMFELFSGLRYANGAGLRMEWVDEENDLIAIPASARKTGKNKRGDFYLPLTDPMREILERARAINAEKHAGNDAAQALLFPQEFQQEKTRLAGKPWGPVSGNKVNDVIDKCHPENGHATSHGFRSSFKEWAAHTGVSDEVSEKCLDHVDPDKTRRAYLRSDLWPLRKEVMTAWSDYIVGGAS